MKIISIKRLVLALILSLGSIVTLPAYAWPDTDEMNMCGAAVKNVRAYGNNFSGWAAHDNYIAQRGNAYYYRTNCPQSKATKNYKGKNWSPGVKMRVKLNKPVKQKNHKKNMHKHHNKHHNKHHKNHADCVRTDGLNNAGLVVSKATRRSDTVDQNFYRQAMAVLNMSKVKRVSKVHHNANHKNHADCVRTDGLNNSGAVIRVVQ